MRFDIEARPAAKNNCQGSLHQATNPGTMIDLAHNCLTLADKVKKDHGLHVILLLPFSEFVPKASLHLISKKFRIC